MTDNLCFLSNNVNGLCSSKKRVKMFKYLKYQDVNNSITFLQEPYFLEKNFNEW